MNKLLFAGRRTRNAVRMSVVLLFGATLALLVTPSATAENLTASEGAPFWMHFGATALLYSHIASGVAGIVAGIVASFSRKGGRLHRAAGKTFWAAMFLTYLIGAGVAPFLEEGQRPNFVAGILALYMLLTGVGSVRRKPITAGKAEWLGLGVALSITLMGVVFMFIGASSESGTVDGSPPQAFVLFVVAGSIAVLGEINVLSRGGLAGPARINRHLWRMCFSFFIATGSLFFGQPQIFPDWFNASPLPFFCSFLPFFVLLYGLVVINLPPLLRRLKAKTS